MRTSLKALLLAGFGITLMLPAAPPVAAADLSLQRVKRVAVRHVHHRSPVVRDYDGTPIVIRRRAVVVSDADGVVRMSAQYEAIPMPAAQPRRWLNGEPVLPNYPRGWPRGLRYAWR